MSRPDQFFEWRQLVEHEETSSVGSGDRLRLLFGAFVLACVAILARAAQLEWTHGAAYREAAARPGRQIDWLPPERGSILARDGTVLAEDAPAIDLEVEYRALEEPPDAAWLRRQARARLPANERGRADRVAAAEATIREERTAWRRRLALVSGVSEEQWRRRCARIQERVERIAERVNAFRAERRASAIATDSISDEAEAGGALRLAWDLFAINDAAPDRRTIVAEERAYHIVVAGLSPAAAAAVRAALEPQSGARVVERLRRRYPQGELAANLVGRLGRNDAALGVEPATTTTLGRADATVLHETLNAPPAANVAALGIGVMGVERAGEATLRGKWGQQVHSTNQRRQRTALASAQAPERGGDIRLTLDPIVQRTAEALLDRTLASAAPSADRPIPKGGAIVVMHVATGELLAAATAPRFDPNVFAGGDDAAIEALLTGDRQPLFDRATKMALPPGSVFKVITALASLETGATTPETSFACQGFLREPEHWRCAIYRHSGIGHGQIRLGDALARSCNVAFFQLAEQLGPGPLVTWAERFGVGARTGLDLGDEARGSLVTPGSLPRVGQRAWQTADTLNLAIGQGAITATPLQVARWMAAIGNGGDLVTPRLLFVDEGSPTAARQALPSSSTATSLRPVIHAASLQDIREGLEQTVTDREGTGHAALGLCWPPVAGKTGTAEIGGGRPDHAWFAGYTPVERPQWAIVVSLEEGGAGPAAAAPLARRIAQTLVETGHIADP